MSYVSSTGGLGSYGGLGYYGLGATLTINWSAGNTGVRDLQQELQRLRFLEPGGGEFGADGKWGPRTESAIRAAARYVGWEGDAYTAHYGSTQKTGTVDVPDDLIERLRAASPPPAGTPGTIGPSDALAPTALVEPGPEEPLVTRPSGEAAKGGWVPAAVIGGVVLVIGGGIWWSMRPKKGARITANRRRSRRRRRRR